MLCEMAVLFYELQVTYSPFQLHKPSLVVKTWQQDECLCLYTGINLFLYLDAKTTNVKISCFE